jgi:hypothetical protein
MPGLRQRQTDGGEALGLGEVGDLDVDLPGP